MPKWSHIRPNFTSTLDTGRVSDHTEGMDENSTTYVELLSSEFRAEAARQRLTNAKLADRIGISRQTMHSQLSGKINLKLLSMAKIADSLNTPLSELMKRAETQLGAPGSTTERGAA